MALSDTAIRKVKPTDKAQRLFDAGACAWKSRPLGPSGGSQMRCDNRVTFAVECDYANVEPVAGTA